MVTSSSAVVRRSRVVKDQVVRALRSVVRRDAQFRSCRVLNGDRLLSRSAVASIVCRSERANNRVVAGSIARDGLARNLNGHFAAVVRRCRVVKDQVVRALRSVVRWVCSAVAGIVCRVLNNGVLPSSMVSLKPQSSPRQLSDAVASSSIALCRSERANNRVVAGSVASDGLARNLNRHCAAVVRRCRVVKDQVVRALRSVVRWDAQLWSCRVLNGDGLLS